MEEWKGLIYQGVDYSGYYDVSTYGRLRNSRTLKVVRLNIISNGYLGYCASFGSRHNKKTIRIHKAVSETFIFNDDVNKCEVNHKDGNKMNNHVSNLEWVTPSDNTKHAYRLGLRDHYNRPKKPVYMIDIGSDKILCRFDSIREAAKFLGDVSYNKHIVKVCKNQRKSAYGYKWRYV